MPTITGAALHAAAEFATLGASPWQLDAEAGCVIVPMGR
jgi:hypothetical protein